MESRGKGIHRAPHRRLSPDLDLTLPATASISPGTPSGCYWITVMLVTGWISFHLAWKVSCT